MENLHSVLERVRYKDRHRILWIDGISINQEDMEECSQQVLLLKNVYENAETILCWVDEEKDNTRDIVFLTPNPFLVFGNHLDINVTSSHPQSINFLHETNLNHVFKPSLRPWQHRSHHRRSFRNWPCTRPKMRQL